MSAIWRKMHPLKNKGLNFWLWFEFSGSGSVRTHAIFQWDKVRLWRDHGRSTWCPQEQTSKPRDLALWYGWVRWPAFEAWSRTGGALSRLFANCLCQIGVIFRCFRATGMETRKIFCNNLSTRQKPNQFKMSYSFMSNNEGSISSRGRKCQLWSHDGYAGVCGSWKHQIS